MLLCVVARANRSRELVESLALADYVHRAFLAVFTLDVRELVSELARAVPPREPIRRIKLFQEAQRLHFLWSIDRL